MLSIKNLDLSYKKDKILQNINLNISKGQVVCVTGASGSGKSSLLKLINGIIPEINEAQVSGEIVLNNIQLDDMDISQRSNYISTVFQNPKTQFYCVDSTDELAFPLENRNVSKEEILKRIDEYTKILSTEKLLNRNIFSLSGGEKQLMAITSVMTVENDVYLFDEPSAALDQKSIELLKKAILKLKEDGKIVLIAEHRLYYLMDIIDKLAILKDGKMEVVEVKSINYGELKDVEKKFQLRSLNQLTKQELIKNKSYYKIDLCNKATTIEVENKVLRSENFKHSFNKDKIIDIDKIEFTHDIYFIIGENGVGKSTFVKKLSKLLKRKGKSYYNDVVIKKSYEYISMVMQDVNYQIFTESVWSEISIVSDDDDKKEQILREFNLFSKKNSHPQSLSGGEKQRLMIALAIASGKPIVILDEPTSGLCKGQMTSTINYLKKMRDEGKLVIVITHDYELINECDGIIYEFIS